MLDNKFVDVEEREKLSFSLVPLFSQLISLIWQILISFPVSCQSLQNIFSERAFVPILLEHPVNVHKEKSLVGFCSQHGDVFVQKYFWNILKLVKSFMEFSIRNRINWCVKLVIIALRSFPTFAAVCWNEKVYNIEDIWNCEPSLH